jgi:hypothetical protein
LYGKKAVQHPRCTVDLKGATVTPQQLMRHSVAIVIAAAATALALTACSRPSVAGPRERSAIVNNNGKTGEIPVGSTNGTALRVSVTHDCTVGLGQDRLTLYVRNSIDDEAAKVEVSQSVPGQALHRIFQGKLQPKGKPDSAAPIKPVVLAPGGAVHFKVYDTGVFIYPFNDDLYNKCN